MPLTLMRVFGKALPTAICRFENEEKAKMDMTEQTRAAVFELLEQPDGCVGLAETDLGLASTIRIISETIEKRVAAGEGEDKAVKAAITLFELYLEQANPKDPEPFAFAKWMARTAVPTFETRDGKTIHNANAVEIR